MWTKDLSTAPKKVGDNQIVVACGSDFGAPISLKYCETPEPEIPISGYWTYCEDNLSEITGGVQEDEYPNIYWMIVDLPEGVV